MGRPLALSLTAVGPADPHWSPVLTSLVPHQAWGFVEILEPGCQASTSLGPCADAPLGPQTSQPSGAPPFLISYPSGTPVCIRAQTLALQDRLKTNWPLELNCAEEG